MHTQLWSQMELWGETTRKERRKLLKEWFKWEQIPILTPNTPITNPQTPLTNSSCQNASKKYLSAQRALNYGDPGGKALATLLELLCLRHQPGLNPFVNLLRLHMRKTPCGAMTSPKFKVHGYPETTYIKCVPACTSTWKHLSVVMPAPHCFTYWSDPSLHYCIWQEIDPVIISNYFE